MTFRVVAMSVFAFGVVAVVAALLLDGGRSPLDPEFAAATTEVTAENFSDVVLASEKPVVIDFYGDYCTVCRQLEPELLAVINEDPEAAAFARVNVQQAPELAKRYEVRAVPTLVVIHRGERVFHGAGRSALQPMRVALESATAEDGL